MHASLQGSLVIRAREDLSMDDDRDHFEVSAQQQSLFLSSESWNVKILLTHVR